MAGFIFLKLNNHQICQNTALRSEFPLIVYFHMGTDNCNVLFQSRAVQTAAALRSSRGKLGTQAHPGSCHRARQEVPQEGDAKPQPNGKKERGVVFVLQMQTFCRKQHFQEEFLYRKGGQALAGLPREVMEPPSPEASKE